GLDRSTDPAVAFGEQLEWSRVETSVALVIDPAEPGPSCCDMIPRGPQPDVGAQFGRRAASGVVSLAQPVLLNQGRVQRLYRPVMNLAGHRRLPSRPSVGFARKEERGEPSERS